MEGADNELTGELVTMNSPRWSIGVIPTPSQGPLPLYVGNRSDGMIVIIIVIITVIITVIIIIIIIIIVITTVIIIIIIVIIIIIIIIIVITSRSVLSMALPLLVEVVM